jgi:superfamily II RNA helicase
MAGLLITDWLPDRADESTQLAGYSEDDVYAAVLDWADGLGLSLYPAQDEAMLEILSGSNVILSTPTGSGKSLVAVAAHLAALADGRRSCYTAPIKALVSEKFFALCDIFGADNVGMLTGDASVNPGAPIVCATAEVLANIALRDGVDADFSQVVMDEFHYYADPQRGWAWQVPLLEMPHAQFLLMSATLGDVSFFVEDLERRTRRETALVSSAERPVPLQFSYVTTALHETVEELLATHQAPAYVVHFTQASAVAQAQSLTSIPLRTKEQKQAIAQAIGDFRFASGFGKTLSRLLRHGVGVHHAGMLPRYRRLVERLAQAGLLAVISGTDTLGVGINVPIRTVVVTGLSKYDGRRVRHLKAREFHQVAGRAGRAGYDTTGFVVVQAPDHVVENERALAKAGEDPKKRRKVVRRKPPEGSVSWTQQTYERLVAAEPEPLRSQFRVTHAMVLHLMRRPDPVAAVRGLILGSHASPELKRELLLRAVAIVRSFLAAEIVEPVRLAQTAGDAGPQQSLRLTIDPDEEFALDQPLSPFALAALDLLDPASETYAVDVLSVLEATLEDPVAVLRAQERRAKDEAMAQMKAAGMEYEERMARLDEVRHPQPLAELLEAAFATYRQGHPWVTDYELHPKSVARDMFEQAMTFSEFVSTHQLARSEGLVLRYLSDVYRYLRHTVPERLRTDEVTDIIAWVGELVRQIDSSLLDEWEQLRSADDEHRAPVPVAEHEPPPLTANARAFRVLVRNEMFLRVRLLARRDWVGLAELEGDDGFTTAQWREAFEPYFHEHDEVLTDADARGPALFDVSSEPDGRRGVWEVRQTIHDPQDHHDWYVRAEVDLAASDERGEPVIRVVAVGS